MFKITSPISALGREVPGNEIIVAPNCRRFTVPIVSCSCCGRILCQLRVCFESRVNIWHSKHHIQHISVSLGLFSILFSLISKTQNFKGGFSYGNE